MAHGAPVFLYLLSLQRFADSGDSGWQDHLRSAAPLFPFGCKSCAGNSFSRPSGTIAGANSVAKIMTMSTALARRRLLLSEVGREKSLWLVRRFPGSRSVADEVRDFGCGVGDRFSIRVRQMGHVPSNEELVEFADHVFFGKPLSVEFGQRAYPEEPAGFAWAAPARSASSRSP
jgi:hypothetical protein